MMIMKLIQMKIKKKVSHVHCSCRGVCYVDLVRNSFIILCKYVPLPQGFMLQVALCTEGAAAGVHTL